MSDVAEREKAIAALAARQRCTGPLPADEIARGAHLCWSNARSLLSDVRLLMSDSRLPRALSLTVLALEELAKPPLLWSVEPSDDAPTWDKLWRKRFSRHSEKQEIVASYGLLTGLGSRIYAFQMSSSTVEALDTLKQWGFYVDCVDGSFQSPSGFANEILEILDLLFAVAEERADSFAAFHSSAEQSLQAHEQRFKGERFGQFWPPSVRSEAELRGVLLSVASQYSTTNPPNYAAFEDACNDLIRTAGKERVDSVLKLVGRECARRAQFHALPTAAARASFMMKLCLYMVPQEQRKSEIEQWRT